MSFGDNLISNNVAQEFVDDLPFSAALSMTVEEVGQGRACLSMPYDPKIVGSPVSGVVHGGAVSALLDTCAGLAVLSHPSVFSEPATLNLRLDYMRPATPEHELKASAECFNVTRTVAFVRATAYDEDKSRPVAAASGIFAVKPSRGSVKERR